MWSVQHGSLLLSLITLCILVARELRQSGKDNISRTEVQQEYVRRDLHDVEMAEIRRRLHHLEGHD